MCVCVRVGEGLGDHKVLPCAQGPYLVTPSMNKQVKNGQELVRLPNTTGPLLQEDPIMIRKHNQVQANLWNIRLEIYALLPNPLTPPFLSPSNLKVFNVVDDWATSNPPYLTWVKRSHLNHKSFQSHMEY